MSNGGGLLPHLETEKIGKLWNWNYYGIKTDEIALLCGAWIAGDTGFSGVHTGYGSLMSSSDIDNWLKVNFLQFYDNCDMHNPTDGALMWVEEGDYNEPTEGSEYWEDTCEG